MKRLLTWRFLLLTLLLVMLGGFSAQAQNTTDGIDEIVVIGTDGYVYVYDYTGKMVYQSPEGGWLHLSTADMNGDGDHEIIVANDRVVKVYDPQIVNNNAYSYTTSYTARSGSFTNVVTGNFLNDDGNNEIALVLSRGGTVSRIVVYDPPQTNPDLDYEFCCSNWDNIIAGDFDGDGDDDYGLTYWNSSAPDGFRSVVEFREGNDPEDYIDNNDRDAQTLSNSQVFDLVAGDFRANSNRVDWALTQNLDRVVMAQYWDGDDIETAWSIRGGGGFNFIAAADFRDENDVDQLVMLRNLDPASTQTSLQFVKNGTVWSSKTGLGGGWLNLAAGNLDIESGDRQYEEAVLLRGDLIRIYLITQNTSTFLDCNVAGNCLEIGGSFRGALAVADVGVNLEIPEEKQAEPFRVEPTEIRLLVEYPNSIPSPRITIYGEAAIDVPMEFGAFIVPGLNTLETQRMLEENPAIAEAIVRGEENIRVPGTLDFPRLDWLTLSRFSGTTTPTRTIVSAIVSNPSPGYRSGTIIFYRADLSNPDRFRYTDVHFMSYTEQMYLPLTLR